MARGRMISKSLSTSRKYAALNGDPLGEFCQALYPLLIAHADDFGRLEGDVFTVHHAVIPSSKRDETEIQQALSLLDKVRLVSWYDVKGLRYLQITDFERHQVGLHKRTASRFPRVPGKSGKSTRLPSELKRTELKRTEENRTQSSAASSTIPIRVITKIAHEAIALLGPTHGDLTETVKSMCASNGIEYDSGSVRKAIESAIAQRKRSA